MTNTPGVNWSADEFSIPFAATALHNCATRLIEQTHDKFRWQMADDFAPLLKAVLRVPGRVVKESAAKIVTENSIAGRTFFVKRYRHASVPLRPLKFLFKPTQAAQEWRLAGAMDRLNVPIVRHVALGELHSAVGIRESVLITEAFAGVPVNKMTATRERIVEFVDGIWRAGVFHRDLHPANLLINPATGELRLVDLHGIVIRREPIEQERKQMLATMHMTLPLPVPRDVEQLSAEMRKRAFFVRSSRSLRTNRDFSIRRFGQWKWNVRNAAMTSELERILCFPDSFIESATPLKRGRSATVAGDSRVVLKRHNFKKAHNPLKDLFRGSRARQGFRKAYHLELCRIATPRAIAAADHRVFGFPTRSFLLMEQIPGAVDAGKWTGDERAGARALGQLIGRLHGAGFIHRDLKETNLLFDAHGVPHLIDLDGLHFVSSVSNESARLHLKRLAEGIRAAGKLSRQAMIVFLLHYCRARRIRPRALFPRA
jgi:tRNA A-37 threonylcarbamoyl transferase component Bud32